MMRSFKLPVALASLFLACLDRSSSAVPLGRVARAFPDTRSEIRVFSDQLPGQLTDAQWRFVASHYAGSQKQTRTWVQHLRRLNPNYLLLHYQLAVGNGPAAFVEDDQWTNDFPLVSQNEDWFMHDGQGQRLHQPAWDWYVMDIRFNGDRPRTGYPDYWAKTALRRMRANEDDGCFADSYTQDILIGQLQPSTPLFSDPALNKRDWLPNLNRYGAFCAAAFHEQPEKFYYLPNLGGLVTGWDTVTDLQVGDGGMVEGFGAWGPGSYFAPEDWKLQMDRVLQLSRRHKIVLCQTAISRANVDHRAFIVGSYLLTKGPQSFLNMLEKSSLEWYPEYGLRLGAYAEEPKASVMNYWNPRWKVFRREFARGAVLVNPGETAVSIPDVGPEFSLVTAAGGGPVGDDGKPTGTLSALRVRSVTIPPHSARFLYRGRSIKAGKGFPKESR